MGFASGDRVVVGHWDVSPLGPFVDLMWATPDGERVLVVAEDRVGAFITAVYEFDRVEVDRRLEALWDGRTLAVVGSDRRVALRVGRGIPFPPRPLWVTRWVEPPIGRWAAGAVSYGTSPTGVREWYPARRLSPIVRADAWIGNQHLGELGPPLPPAGFGFSEPPRWPTLTEVRPRLEDPSGRLDRRLAELAPDARPPVTGR